MHRKTSLEAFQESPHPAFKHTTYFDVYDQLLEKYQGKEITFVEVGILNGGSLFMWRNFFGEKARIIGIDLNPEAKKWEAEGFEIYIGNQTNPAFWREFLAEIGPIDVFLDDGGHSYPQQVITTECVMDSIKDGGILIVEDTHTSYMKGFGRPRKSFTNYAKTWIDKINSRFRKFTPHKNATKIWSVEIFESIIAFKVNQKASTLQSKPIWNKKPDKMAKDYKNENIMISEESQKEADEIYHGAFE